MSCPVVVTCSYDHNDYVVNETAFIQDLRTAIRCNR